MLLVMCVACEVSSSGVCGLVSLDAVDWTLPQCSLLRFSHINWSLSCSLLLADILVLLCIHIFLFNSTSEICI